MKIIVGITTYDRPEEYRATVKAIRKAAPKEHTVGVVAVQDGGPMYVRNGKLLTVSYKEHGGKRGYWATVSHLWSIVKEKDPDVFIQVPDDFRYSPGWMDTVLDILSQLDENAFLNILPCGRKQWRFHPHPHPSLPVDDFAFIDGAFATTRRGMKALRWSAYPMPDEYFDQEGIGSGVWRLVSGRLRTKRVPMYRMQEAVVFTDWSGEKSKMNPHRHA